MNTFDIKSPEFWKPADVDGELRRVYDICNGCRRCLPLCPSFKVMFDRLDVDAVDGEVEKLPAPESGQSPDLFSHIDPFNPFLIVAVIVVGGIFRGIFGRFFGSLATGGLVAALFWFIAASLALSAISGIIAFLVTLFSDAMMSSGGAGRGGGWVSGGGYSGGSSSGGGGGGFSGGGGSFGGGGASGSW
jgi:uncharacterized protein